MITGYVQIWSYMGSWILRHQHSGVRLVMREISRLVGAESAFKPGTRTEAGLDK